MEQGKAALVSSMHPLEIEDDGARGSINRARMVPCDCGYIPLGAREIHASLAILPQL
jgi:hypothetical protein